MSTIDVLCSSELLTLVAAIEQAPIPHADETAYYVVARFEESELRAIDDQVDATFGAFWREIGGLTIEIPLDEDAIRRDLLSHIWQYVTTERHIAGAIGDLAHAAGMSPVEFTRWATTADAATAPAAPTAGAPL